MTHLQLFACCRCGAEWPRTPEHFRFKPNNVDKMSGTCRACDRKRISAWNDANRERRNETRRLWRLANPEKCRAQTERQLAKGRASRGYVRSTPEQKAEMRRAAKRRYYAKSLKARLLRRVRNRVLKAVGGKMALGRTLHWLGCTPADLVAHLEAQFQPGMTWENRGEWHIDHIRPLASFDLTDREQVRAASHYTNLQPLWAADNQAKGARLDWAPGIFLDPHPRFDIGARCARIFGRAAWKADTRGTRRDREAERGRWSP